MRTADLSYIVKIIVDDTFFSEERYPSLDDFYKDVPSIIHTYRPNVKIKYIITEVKTTRRTIPFNDAKLVEINL
jgi:hypothetical protein